MILLKYLLIEYTDKSTLKLLELQESILIGKGKWYNYMLILNKITNPLCSNNNQFLMILLIILIIYNNQ